MALVAVARHARFRGYDGPGSTAPVVYDVLPLREALERTYSTDAHLIAYVVDGAERQPRIRKMGLPSFDGRVTMGVFLADVDNPGHGAWTDELLDRLNHQYETLNVLQTAGLYLTAHGCRIVQPLGAPIPVAEVEPYLKRWLSQLEAAGLAVDWACRDWTRHFRLPHVRRDGIMRRSPLVLLERMRAIALEPIVVEPAAVTEAMAAPIRAAPPISWTSDVPEVWQPRVQMIAGAIRDVTTEWHTLFLAVAGALACHGAPPEHVPALCGAISLATGYDARTADREAAARSTIERKLRGEPIVGYPDLRRHWPAVADAFDSAMVRGQNARLRALAAAHEHEAANSVEQATAVIYEAFDTAGDGLTVLSAECGLGKTRAAIDAAARRAAKSYATPHAHGCRAPLDSKTAISVDKTDLARQVVSDLRVKGVSARRIFGPLSVVRDDGTYECRLHEQASALVAGGQPMQWELCRGRDEDPCPHFDECTAHQGSDGPDDARVIVGPHALLPHLDGAAGKTGLLVIDEPPSILETEAITLADVELTRAALRHFDGRYVGALTPALEAARIWLLALGQPDGRTELEHIIRTCERFIDPEVLAQAQRSAAVRGDAVDCGRATPFPKGRTGTAPPIDGTHLALARRDLRLAEQIGGASRVLKTLHHALVSPTPVSVRLDERDGNRVLVFTRAQQPFIDALRREGRVIVMDANAKLNLPIYEKVVGYAPRHLHASARDGARIERTLLRWRSATRRKWIQNGKLLADPSLVAAVRALFEWAKEDWSVESLGIITMLPIELALRGARDPEDAEIDRQWEARGEDLDVLAQLRAELGPIFQGWSGSITFGHYGAVRGLNTMADVDALVTLGDPWPNLGQLRADVDFLALDEGWEQRLEELCRAELEQAQGRLRVVHRKRRGRALHVGNVLPGGWGWEAGKVTIRAPKPGRRPQRPALTHSTLAACVEAVGGVRATARLTNRSPTAIRKYLQGTSAIPSEVAELLLRRTQCNPKAELASSVIA